MNDPFFGEVIHSYSRAQAIEDGVLVDLMQGEMGDLVREAGFNYPIAMTATAFDKYVHPIGGELPKGYGQSLTGRLWDVLMMLKYAIKTQPRSPQVTVRFRCIPNDTKTGTPRPALLKSICGPGDDLQPVITIMLPEED